MCPTWLWAPLRVQATHLVSLLPREFFSGSTPQFRAFIAPRCFVLLAPTNTQRAPEPESNKLGKRVSESQRIPENPRESQRIPKNPKESQRIPENPREHQRTPDPENPREHETHRKSKNTREHQRT